MSALIDWGRKPEALRISLIIALGGVLGQLIWRYVLYGWTI
jgi:hypothetical protein